ncbi:hypothetical protein MBRA1_003036 [Malassezia brasiliensis]|uniref:Roadblock/LAMTOR2 domain-containing protein n=1 Tax=Malassezia brasiliensis TaxID=1821822 RepID=A0AAF0DV75_9BASI|nr:hypothetical protein MBRA1_003036 [Malassezia brasiliensis]
MDARGASVPAVGDAPDEAVRILTHLTQHRQVRGCVTLSAPDCRVLWSGGAAFAPGASPDGDATLARVVQFVRELLDVTQRHISLFDHDDELGLLRIRTSHYELLVTPSEKYVLVVVQEPGP